MKSPSALMNPAFDPLGLEGLPDVDNLDSAVSSAKRSSVAPQGAAAPVLQENSTPLPQPKADEAPAAMSSPIQETPVPQSTPAATADSTALDPSDIYGN
jgi:hypothetical protein